MATSEITQSSDAIRSFRAQVRESITEIRVSQSENQPLFPLYEHIRFTFGKHYSGILIVDTQGIYTPIEKYDENVLHLIRLPKSNVTVYAVTDLRSVVYTTCQDLTILFQGVYMTVNGTYDFISREYFIRPVPGISFEKSMILQHVIVSSKFNQIIYEDYEDSDDSDDGLD